MVMSLMVLWGQAQTNLVFYNTNDQYNAPGFNPAFLTNQKKFTLSIFPLSGMSVAYNNQEPVRGMLNDILAGSLTKENMNKVLNTLLTKDLFSQRFEIPLISFGYNSHLGSFSFRINEIEQMRTALKGDFTQFISNPEFLTIKLNQPQNLYANAVHYREYSLGYAREIIKNKLSFGIRAKVYFGKASLFSEVPGQVTEKNGYYFLETTGPLKTSAPLEFIVGNDSIITGANPSKNFTPLNYLFNTKNIGIGIDLGITYEVNPDWQVSASIVDFGKINWNYNLNSMNLHGKYEILPEYIVDKGADYITKDPAFISTNVNFNELFKSVIDSTSRYSTTLPTSFFAGLQYQMNPTLKFGLVDRFVKSKGMNQNSFSLTANYMVNSKLSLSGGYATIGKTYNNIPFALIYNWGSGQAFLGTDNLTAFLFPSAADYAGIAFGTCFYLFKPKVKYRESEYIPFYKEKKRSILRN